MSHFYLDESLNSALEGETLSLVGAEARHAGSVSRIRPGETVLLGNGAGLVATVEALRVEKDRVDFRVLRSELIARPTPRVTLVQALTKGDRDERAIEAATELGVDEIVPWSASRCISVWTGDKIARGEDRWRTIVREATKQCLRAFLPAVRHYASIETLCSELGHALILVLDPHGDVTSERAWSQRVTEARQSGRDIAIVVGPEGGITPAELELFTQAGAVRVRLGAHILRSSTAGPAFLSAINASLGRW